MIISDREGLRAMLSASLNKQIATCLMVPEDILDNRNDGRWSAGQIFEHLIKVQVGMIRIFSGPSEKAERSASDKVVLIRQVFDNDEVKLTAGGPVAADDSPKNKDRIHKKLVKNRDELLELLSNIHLENECTGFSHARFGIMTPIEWVHFEDSHSARHLRQVFEQTGIRS